MLSTPANDGRIKYRLWSQRNLAIVIGVLAIFGVVLASVAYTATTQAPDPASWANPVGCVGHTAAGSIFPQVVSIEQILGTSYPSQSLVGSMYQVNGTGGGIPNKRVLVPPCSIINIRGQNVTSLVEVDHVWLSGYHLQTSDDCAYYPAGVVNGTICDAIGNLFDPTASHSCYHISCVHIEIDRTWINSGQCNTSYCDYRGLAAHSCGDPTTGCQAETPSSCFTRSPTAGLGECLDFQGFVYWDPEPPAPHWELHPLTAWRLHPRPFLS